MEVLERLAGRLLGDVFDVEPATYERHAGRRKVSGHATLNALLSGGVPGTPPRPLMAIRLAPLSDLENASEHFIASAVGGRISNLGAVVTGDLVTLLLIQMGDTESSSHAG